jgi:hypothetical protein
LTRAQPQSAVDLWTPDIVEERLIDWADTLRRLPDREHAWLYGQKTYWPVTLREAQDVFSAAVENGGRHEDMSTPFMPADREAIARFWETTEWFFWIERPHDRKLAAAVALCQACWKTDKVRWGWVKNVTGLRVHYTTLQRRYDKALSIMAQRLAGRVA